MLGGVLLELVMSLATKEKVPSKVVADSLVMVTVPWLAVVL